MSFNDCLINGDMKTLRNLILEGKTWVGDKTRFDENEITHPVDPIDFAEHLKLILDLELCDSNFIDDDNIYFTWYVSLLKEQCLSLLEAPTASFEDIAFKCIIGGYLDVLNLCKEGNVAPQILISKASKDLYQITIEAYEDNQVHDVLTEMVDGNKFLMILARLAKFKFYTC